MSSFIIISKSTKFVVFLHHKTEKNMETKNKKSSEKTKKQGLQFVFNKR